MANGKTETHVTDDPVRPVQYTLDLSGNHEAVPTVAPISDADSRVRSFNATYDENARRRGQYDKL